jgi:hypothetical protein
LSLHLLTHLPVTGFISLPAGHVLEFAAADDWLGPGPGPGLGLGPGPGLGLGPGLALALDFFSLLSHFPVVMFLTWLSLHLLTHLPVTGFISLPAGQLRSITGFLFFNIIPITPTEKKNETRILGHNVSLC